MENDTATPTRSSVELVITNKREGVTYDLYTKPCSCCEKIIYFIGRTDGARISCFQTSKERSENVEEVIDEIHERFAIDTKGLISCLETTIDEITSKMIFLAFLPRIFLIIE
jgi:hypothetical protein